MQPGEGELGFGLDPSGCQNLKSAGPRPGAGGGDEGRLADARLSEQDERIAVFRDTRKHGIEDSGLSRAAIERELRWRV
jgi:hypothetical protein